MQLDQKIAVLTGASSGLGSALAEALVQKGTKVYGLARNSDALSKLQDKLGSDFIPVRMDITDEEGVAGWLEDTFSFNHIPNILINNAGVGSFGKIDEIDSHDWLKTMNTNLNGIFYITSGVVALMKQSSQSRHIINIGSILGTTGRPEGAAYCASKFGINGFSEALFKELRFFDIKVSCVNPGSIETDFFSSSGIKSHHNMLHPEDLTNTIIHVLETPDNMLINELTVRPLNPKPPRKK